MSNDRISETNGLDTTSSKHTELVSILSEQEPSTPRKSWRAPLIICVSLTLGLIIALAHHFMNQYLSGKAMDEVELSQAWVSRFGTALAFLVKMCFTIAVGAAYTQRQWWEMRHENFTIQDVDNLTSVLGNALNFVSSSVWFRVPNLTCIALVSWLVVPDQRGVY